MAKEEKSPEETLLSIVKDAFDRQGTWPTWQYVEAVIDQDHQLELNEVLASARRSRVFSNGTQDGSEVILTVAGLAAAGAERDVRRFVEALRWCVAEQMGFRPDPGKPEEVRIDAERFKSEWESRGEKVRP